jgi:hypothetical protein
MHSGEWTFHLVLFIDTICRRSGQRVKADRFALKVLSLSAKGSLTSEVVP